VKICGQMNRKELKGAIIGMALGDAHLEASGKNTASVLIEHKADSTDLMDFKCDILNQVCKTTYSKYNYPNGKGYVSGSYDVLRLRAKAHPLFGKLRHRLYFEGRRTVDRHLVNSLSPLGLAIWYMDDGSLKWKGRSDKSRDTSAKCWEVVFATHAYSLVENEALAACLHDRFNLSFSIQRQNQYWYLNLRAKSQEEFWNLAAPYVCMVDSMHYKLPPTILRQYRAEPDTREG